MIVWTVKLVDVFGHPIAGQSCQVDSPRMMVQDGKLVLDFPHRPTFKVNATTAVMVGGWRLYSDEVNVGGHSLDRNIFSKTGETNLTLDHIYIHVTH